MISFRHTLSLLVALAACSGNTSATLPDAASDLGLDATVTPDVVTPDVQPLDALPDGTRIGRCTANSAGFGDCDGDAANGCETALATSTAHCGACRNACPAPANATASCAAGACTPRFTPTAPPRSHGASGTTSR